MPLVEWVGLGVAAVVAVALVGYYLRWALRTRERTGRLGLLQHSRLTCPKCSRTFDYSWVPGAALTALRLGRGRYMACPLCHRWSVFDLRASLTTEPDPGHGQRSP
jgi:hypothetical protein